MYCIVCTYLLSICPAAVFGGVSFKYELISYAGYVHVHDMDAISNKDVVIRVCIYIFSDIFPFFSPFSFRFLSFSILFTNIKKRTE